MRPIRIAAFALVLIVSSIAAETETAGPPAGDYWYRLDIDGKHAGWARDTIEDLESRAGTVRVIESSLLLHCKWEVDTDMELHVGPKTYSGPRHFSIDLKQETYLVARYRDGDFVSSEYRSVERDTQTTRVTVKWTVHGYEVTVSKGTDTLRRTVDPEAFDATSNALYERADLAAGPGEPQTLRILDLTTGDVVRRTFTLVGTERRSIGDRRRTVRRIESTDETETVVTFVDEATGLAVRVDLPGEPPIRVESESRERALDFTPPELEMEPPSPTIGPDDSTA